MLSPKYGLPAEIKFCKKCVISNQRPNSAIEFQHTKDSKKETINFSSEGICDACIFAEIKDTKINWEEREQELTELAKKFESFPGKYNCLVPGSGGKDSFFQAHILKYKYGFRPLTITWAPNIYTDWGWKNHQSWIHSGFDNILVTPNGKVHRLLTRLALQNLFHPFQPFIFGQKNLAPKFASYLNIPIIFYGENEAEYGNPLSHTQNPKRSLEYFSKSNNDEVILGGVSFSRLISEFKLKPYELEQYMPINSSELRDKDIEVHYLGYYLRWHPQAAYYYAVENGEFIPSPERTPGTYSKYNSIDDKIDDLHYWTTYIKFGIGRATYDASQEIRNKEITRDEAVTLVKRFDGEWPARFEKELMQYLSIDKSFEDSVTSLFLNPIMSKEYVLELADNFRSPHLWEKKNNTWTLRATVY